MKKLIRRLLSGALSLITTCLIMASPVAAMVYASEPATAVESFSIKEDTPVSYTEVKKVDIDSVSDVRLDQSTPEKNDISVP